MQTVLILRVISSASVKMDLWEVASAVQVQVLFSYRSWISQFFSPLNTLDEKMDTNLLLANMSQIYINLYLGKTDITFQYRSNNRLLDAIYQV